MKDKNKIVDVAQQEADIGIDIDKVGIKGITYPIVVLDKHREKQQTVATINMTVNLPRQFRGTHMSRFVDILNRYREQEIGRHRVREILEETKEKLQAQESHMEIAFPYFMEKKAPVSESSSLSEYYCKISAILNKNNKFRMILCIEIPVMNLCPCSKELCEQGAHNQRCKVTVQLYSPKLVWIEDIVEMVESSASSPVYTLLKREDEQHICDSAYNRPRFVEDIVREIAHKLSKIEGIKWFSVASENFESIHNHNAYAFIERTF